MAMEGNLLLLKHPHQLLVREAVGAGLGSRGAAPCQKQQGKKQATNHGPKLGYALAVRRRQGVGSGFCLTFCGQG